MDPTVAAASARSDAPPGARTPRPDLRLDAGDDPGSPPAPCQQVHRLPVPVRDLALLLVAVAALAPSIWSETSITGQDEYWLTLRTPMEMNAAESWLTPVLDGEPRLKKPPLLYWLIAASYQVFGIHLFAARMWSVLAGAVLAVCAARLADLAAWSGVATADAEAAGTDRPSTAAPASAQGWLAGLLVLSSVGVAVEARRAMLDLPLAAWTAVAVLLGVHWARCRPRSGRALATALGAGVALAAACMTKGPVALGFFAGAAVAGLLVCGPQRLARRAGSAAVAAAAFVVAAAWWPVTMWLLHEDAVRAAFSDQVSEQGLDPGLGSPFHPESVGPILGGLFGNTAPWSFVLLAVLGSAAVRRGPLRPGAGRAERWTLWWLVLACVPFLFFKTFERYLVPLVVPASVLCACWMLRAGPRLRRVHLVLAVAVIGLPCLAFSAFALLLRTHPGAPAPTAAWLAPLLWAVGLAWTARTARPVVAAFAALVTVTATLGFVYPHLGINRLPRDLPGEVVLADEPRIATFGSARPAMVSVHAGRSIGQMDLHGQEAAVATLRGGWRGVVFTEAVDAPRFEAAVAAAGARAERLGSFGSFFSRKVWLRFVRRDARLSDWQRALHTGSSEPLTPEFVVWRVGDRDG